MRRPSINTNIMMDKDNNILEKIKDYIPYRDNDYQDNDSNKGTKKLFGISLLVFGVLVCGFVLHAIYDLLTGGDYIRLLNAIIPHDLVPEASGDLAGLVKLAEQMFLVIGYIVVLFLLSFAIRIAKVLLQTGAELLNSDLGTLIARLQKELMKWREEGY